MEILYGLRPDFSDLYSITARHYINAGMKRAQQFAFLLDTLIQNVNLSSLEDLNSLGFDSAQGHWEG